MCSIEPAIFPLFPSILVSSDSPLLTAAGSYVPSTSKVPRQMQAARVTIFTTNPSPALVVAAAPLPILILPSVANPLSAALYPATCEVGDLSGKHGTIPSSNDTRLSVRYWFTDNYISTNPGGGAFIGNRSIVIHDAAGGRIACANLTNLRSIWWWG